jgi:hypothetical protein
VPGWRSPGWRSPGTNGINGLLDLNDINGINGSPGSLGSPGTNNAFLQPKKHARNKPIAVLKNPLQNATYMQPIQSFIEKVSNSYDFLPRIGSITCKRKR